VNATATPVLDVTRFHLSLNVNDLGKSVQFLTALLGCPPKKHRRDYAKFEPADLPLVLSLEPRTSPQSPLRNTAGEGPLNHVGIRMTDAAQLVEVQRRLEAAGYSTQREEGVECCYARQTKFWVHDHDRTMWEVYVLEEDLEHRGGQHDELDPHQSDVAVEPLSKAWAHRLSEPFPESIPGSGVLDEIAMQGSWNAERHRHSWSQQLEKVYESLRPGGKLTLHMLTSNEPIERLEPLPGPASVVQVVPLLADVVALLGQTGFINVQLVKYGGSPCFVQQGAELRETRLEAFTRGQTNTEEEMVRVVYKGPLNQLTDDGGTIFERGKPTLVPAPVWQQLAASTMSESFVKLASGKNHVTSCGISRAK
jgi:hypothetical protein